jgi:hypothetical protein
MSRPAVQRGVPLRFGDKLLSNLVSESHCDLISSLVCTIFSLAVIHFWFMTSIGADRSLILADSVVVLSFSPA